MDTELARTFLAVVNAGNSVAAAERLHVTQSTVSARIQTLEQQLRCVTPLIKRGRLHVAEGAPEFAMAAYAAYPDDSSKAATTQAVTLMRQLAGALADPPSRARRKPGQP